MSQCGVCDACVHVCVYVQGQSHSGPRLCEVKHSRQVDENNLVWTGSLERDTTAQLTENMHPLSLSLSPSPSLSLRFSQCLYPSTFLISLSLFLSLSRTRHHNTPHTTPPHTHTHTPPTPQH